MFQALVTVKSGETGTPKAAGKIDATNKVKKAFAESFFEHYFYEDNARTIGLYAGAFKPPHKGHFSIVQQLAKEADEIIVFIGHKVREGVVEISNQQSEDIWKVYANHINKPIHFVKSPITPIKSLYDWVDANKQDYSKIIVGTVSEDGKRFNYFGSHRENYTNVEVKKYDALKGSENQKVSGTDIRINMNYLKSMEWVPDVLTDEEKEKVINIVGGTYSTE